MAADGNVRESGDVGGGPNMFAKALITTIFAVSATALNITGYSTSGMIKLSLNTLQPFLVSSPLQPFNLLLSPNKLQPYNLIS